MLIHYSDKPLRLIYSTEQGEPNHKPKGLWVSVEGEYGWPQWCEQERYVIEHLTCKNIVLLNNTAKIIKLTSPQDIDTFTQQYRSPTNSDNNYCYHIEWNKIAAIYQGIIISPYQWSRRLKGHCFWYYAWDCASGCIWDATAIESICSIS